MTNKFGIITQVIGAVVDVKFSEHLPEISSALECENTGNKLILEASKPTVIIDKNCLRLTSKGKKVVRFSTIFRQYFLPKQRLIRDKYTDELISPLDNEVDIPDYLC